MGKIDIRNLTKKQKMQLRIWIRRLIQLFFFILFPAAYTAAFAGVKYVFTQIGAHQVISVTPFVAVLLSLCLYTIVFGRFFCGNACAFGTLNDMVRGTYVWICKKIKRKPKHFPAVLSAWLKYVKYLVLLLIIIVSFMQLTAKFQGISPWDVFSMLHAGNFDLSGYLVGLIILLLLVAGMIFEERFFCKFFCPMGAVFSLLPILPLFSLFRDKDACIKGCKNCVTKCPASIELGQQGKMEVSGECLQCQKCIDSCPKQNVRTGTRVLRGNEIVFTLIRTAILIALYIGLDI